MTASPLCRPYYHRPPVHEGSIFSRTSGGLGPATVANLYGVQRMTLTVPMPTVALIELGGGYLISAINSWCDSEGYPHPTITDVSIDGAVNSYTGDPQGADVEVTVDICEAIGMAYAMTGEAANIAVLFCPNSDTGFEHGVQYASRYLGCGISWGSAEKSWLAASIQAMDLAFAAGTVAGCTYCCAAGDAGSGDGMRGDNADFPGSSPHVVCCGGTTIVIQNGKIVSEVPWNANGGATGGGYSSLEPVPIWQVGFLPAGRLRGVPDLAMMADPANGCSSPFGPIGGTSIVAPAMATYFAITSAMRGQPLGLVNPLLYENEPTFRDLVSGNNGDFSATKGWDPASGLGAPDFVELTPKLLGTTVTPPPPPPPPPPSGGRPTKGQVMTVIDATILARMKQSGIMIQNAFKLLDGDLHANIAKLYTSADFEGTVNYIVQGVSPMALSPATQAMIDKAQASYQAAVAADAAAVLAHQQSNADSKAAVQALEVELGISVVPHILAHFDPSTIDWGKWLLLLLKLYGDVQGAVPTLPTLPPVLGGS